MARIIKRSQKNKKPRVFSFRVGDGHTASELLHAGRYNWIGDVVREFTESKQFRIDPEPKKIELELVELDYDPTTTQVLKEFKKRGLVEPTEEDALRFGKKYPDLQHKFPIVFLNAHHPWLVDRGLPRVIVLRRFSGGRGIVGYWLQSGWFRHYRFAGRRIHK